MRLIGAGLVAATTLACGGAPDPAAVDACDTLRETMGGIVRDDYDFDQIRAGVAEVRALADQSSNDELRELAAQMSDVLETMVADDFVAVVRLFGRACDDLE